MGWDNNFTIRKSPPDDSLKSARDDRKRARSSIIKEITGFIWGRWDVLAPKAEFLEVMEEPKLELHGDNPTDASIKEIPSKETPPYRRLVSMNLLLHHRIQRKQSVKPGRSWCLVTAVILSRRIQCTTTTPR
jgi:hypothetical protein